LASAIKEGPVPDSGCNIIYDEHGPAAPDVKWERHDTPWMLQPGPSGRLSPDEVRKQEEDERQAWQDAQITTNTISRPVTDGGGLRFSIGKNKIDLVPPEWVWGLGMVLSRGAAKYATRNWERGMAWSEVLGPMFRHAFKFICGERYDPETGCHHMAMVAWNALVLMSYDIRHIGHNDMVGKMEWLSLVATNPGPELQAIIDAKIKEASQKGKAA
jgi:hypothetical protein